MALCCVYMSGNAQADQSPANLLAARYNTRAHQAATALQTDVTVQGTVTDENGMGLPGVTVVLKGTSRGTATDVNGHFSIAVPESGAVLILSYIGYENQEVAVDNQTTLNISLRPDAEALQEVVVVGYGTQKKSDLTGAVTAISSEDFVKGQVTTPEQLITGKVAGVQITSNGGAPGSGGRIRIRSGSSLNANNDPLIVIDGVPLDSRSISGSANPLSFINPNDIASFNILKDASAAAIYGSRAANGVIIITTKKGELGEKLKVSLNSTTSLSTIRKQVDVLSADELRTAVGQYASEGNKGLLGDANTNWQDQIFQDAMTYDNNLTLTGAYKKLPYRVSVGYLDQEGVLKTSSLERTSGSISLTPSLLDDHLKITLNVQAAINKNRFAQQGAIGAAVAFDPTQPVYADNEFGGYFEWTDANGNPNTLAPRNPLSMLEQREDKSTVKRSIGNILLDYKLPFIPELHANLNLGYDISSSEGSIFQPATLASVFVQGGSLSEYEQSKDSKLLDFYLNYVKELPDLNSRIDATAGYSYQDFITEEPSFAGMDAEGNVIPGQEANPFPFKTQYTLIGFFGRLNYSLLDRYLLTANIRRDGSSRFGPGNKWGTFPSLAFAWRINEESFLKDTPWLSELKLRLGYGVTGQQDILTGDYPYLARYTNGDLKTQYQFGDQYYSTLRPEGYDANIKWEETQTINAGLDFGILNGKLSGSIDVYKKKTKDLLAVISVPAGTNLTNRILTNVGNIENKGLEAVLSYTAISNENLTWDISANATFNKSEITNLSKVKDETSVGIEAGDAISGGVGNHVQIHTVGYRPYTFYVYKQVYDQNGNPIEGVYADLNSDGIINAQDRYRYKSPEAQVYLGFSSQLAYNNWNLNFVLRGNIGNYMYNNVNSGNGVYKNLTYPNYLTNLTSDVLETGFNNNQFFSDYYVQNASFLRMENINLGYNFGKILNDKANLRLSVSVQNVFVITKYTGLDPEIASGIDNNFYPNPRVFSFGLNLDI
ncbi:SusC/RagA family TonB-linked outer membrane protein [Pontibacter rufus]|uniref:SusC/RagA family TonB-linked outer membrane protein n=1 Tax=Pontibacter rufus TaxID=2791028 RepID=UPI001E28FB93|nr:TonB-dependent receptor [Pontibacter sp. 172403-2]